MSSHSLNFTIKALDKIKPPKSDNTQKGSVYDTYKDTNESGLILIVTNSGAKTFYLYKKIDRKPTKVKIGKYPDLSIEGARKKARELKGQIATGKNPQEEKRKINNEMTFKELFDKYIEEHAKLHTKSWQDDIADVNRNLKHWFNRKISMITPEEVRKLHADFGDKRGKKGGANRLLNRINAIFNRAINEWGWEGKNPAKIVKYFKTKSRDRFLQPDEIPKLFEKLEESQNEDLKDYVYLSLGTGARRGNIVAMQWEEINFETKEWRIPETKNGESLTVPLHKDMITILKNRKKTSKSPFVFPSDSKKGHILSFKKGWKNLLEKAEIKDFRIHDLRRTMGSYQTILGANSYVVGKSLGHKSRVATDIYARLNLDPVRQSMNSAYDKMKKLSKKRVKKKK